MASGDRRLPVEHTELYRGILLIATVAVPAFALVEWENGYDPFAPRLVFAAIAFVAFVGSYRSERVRRDLRLIAGLLSHAIYLWFMVLSVFLQMHIEIVVGQLPVVCGMALCVRRVRELVASVVFMNVVLVLTYAAVDQPLTELSVPVALFTVFTVGLGWMSVSRSRLEQQLRIANTTLEARVAERTALLAREAAERRAAELRASAASDAKSRFLANMSHELRTPLNAVIGYSELVVDELADTDMAHLCSDLDKVGSAARHLLKILDDVLDLSRVEADALVLRREPVALRPAVEAAAELVQPQLHARRDALELTVPADLALLGDRDALVRVLLHLLDNAAKFTERGTITVTASRLDATVAIEVRDTGIGIPEPALAHIFDRFTQADDSSTRLYGGAGLGLALCRELVTRMGGTLTVTSAVGHGSAFTARLPAA